MTVHAGDALLQVLPPPIRERSRLLNDASVNSNAEFVLYWMHHAVRGHENPALDAAITLGNERQLPVLVCQGLGGRHRFNNDRHYAFILQGARSAHRELRQRGVRAVFHLDRSGTQPSPLCDLIARAAAVVFEDYPAPPFPAWSAKLAERSLAPVFAVDSCCVVPMQLLPKRFDRAYDFRRATAALFAQRVPLTWPSPAASEPAFDGELGFAPLNLGQANIATLCADCAIDHSIPPVAHTPGGSLAGYARWETFRDQGLRTYARERNDAAVAWPRGVSRLSAYLHHGHVSPFRVAREALQIGGEGAEKFLDELLVWRELAYNFCFRTTDPEVIGALPDWAQATLHAHADDLRPPAIDIEALARSCSGDSLWDLAQTSLRIHGELHNNLRMTWAKALAYWRPDAQATMDALIDLNHRYALDGSDPNSYGGLLWSLGLFDRPFADSPVIGRLRSRPSQAHARRLDVAAFRQRVTQPSTERVLSIAVIGAGIAGLCAARSLQDQGHFVTVFEKSRGVGGRAATRRIGNIGFDHGAQYFTARDFGFRRAVEAWRERGLVALWEGRIGCVREDGIEQASDRHARYVGVPGMSEIGRHLGADLDVRKQTRVTAPHHQAGRWRLQSEGGDALGEFDALVVALPAPQTQVLLAAAAPHLARQAAAVNYSPAWAVMLSLPSEPTLPYDGLFFADGEIAWAARNSAKPGRRGHTWVVHAAPDWTRAHLDLPVDQVATMLTASLAARTSMDLDDSEVLATHRWLYSLVDNPLEAGALWDPDLQLTVCGDWCNGARIEGAYLSGQAAAGHLLRHQAQRAWQEQYSAAAAESLAR
ncbi:MAG: FAD-dependent oxidoreductase [Sedimenticolaceae bacterium]